MSKLLEVKLDRSANTAIFFGNTYHYKEEIKLLGKTTFNGADKSWKVLNLKLTPAQLEEKFPGIIIHELSLESSTKEKEVVGSLTLEPSQVVPNNAVSVSEFIFRARNAIKAVFPNSFCIYGIISNCNQSRDTIFIDLSEQEERETVVTCSIRADLEKILEPLKKAGFTLERDLPVMFEVVSTVTNKQAKLWLNVQKIIVEYTTSKLLNLREQTNERLKLEGIFAENKKKQLPFLPKKLGVLTSGAGTVINDFMASLSQAKFAFEINWLKVSVQGQDAKKSIIAGIRQLEKIPDLDAILIFRGGGSPAELSVFNDYEIAKAVCLCSLPVVSAIGHQEDQSSVQDVSAIAFGVPKDIGTFFANIIIDLRNELNENIKVIRHNLENIYQHRQKDFSFISSNILGFATVLIERQSQMAKMLLKSFPSYAKKIAEESNNLLAKDIKYLSAQSQKVFDNFYMKLKNNMHNIISLSKRREEKESEKLSRLISVEREARYVIEKKENSLKALEDLVQAASPEVQLKRGFAFVMSKEQYVKKASQLASDELISIQFVDQRVEAKITK